MLTTQEQKTPKRFNVNTFYNSTANSPFQSMSKGEAFEKFMSETKGNGNFNTTKGNGNFNTTKGNGNFNTSFMNTTDNN